MAHPQEYGYEDDRFENVVSPNFHCSICLNVLKEPKMCRRNQHVFCSSCIERHLQNSATCPECMEELTVDTLNQAPRVYWNCLSELNINCDYFTRGCHDFVQLGGLQSHVMNCGFAPVKCSNDGCAVVVNKRDQIHHETEVCELRKVKCHDCGEIREEIDDLKVNLAEMKINQAEMKINQVEMKEQLTEMKINLAEMKEQLTEMKEQMKETKDQVKEMKDQLTQVKDQLMQLPASLKEDVIKEVRGVMGKVMEKFYHGEQAIHTTVPVEPIKEDIVVAGGEHLSSAEMFSWNKRTWAPLPAMKEHRSAATSFLYENQIIMAGGYNGETGLHDMEMIKIDQELLQWVKFPAKFPAKLTCYKTVVYKDRLFVVGGFNWNEICHSKAIYEVLLIPPYSTKLLCKMPQPREYHGAELIDNKVFILGGQTDLRNQSIINSVVMYHIIKNVCKQMPPLPYAVSKMTTVSWRNKVILMGGVDEKGQVLNNVVMYDTVTGESEMLPSMKYKRKACSAVITANVIVVMGGCNKEHTCLNSVECFSVGSNSWQELPPMIEARGSTTAVVKPGNFD